MTSSQSLWWYSHNLWWDSEHIRNAYQSLVLLTSISVKCIFLTVSKTNNLNTCVILIKHLRFSDLLDILNHFSEFECLFDKEPAPFLLHFISGTSKLKSQLKFFKGIVLSRQEILIAWNFKDSLRVINSHYSWKWCIRSTM